jgi:hypothetical protein
MKPFLFVIIFFIPFWVCGQVTYESSDFVGVNASILTSTSNITIDTGQSISTGENHIWDFQAMNIDDQNILSFTDPNDAGYKVSWCFLNGAIFNCDQAFNDFVNRCSPLLGFNLNGFVLEDAYTHYNLTESTFEEKFIGATVTFGGSPIPATINLENVDTIYQFPLVYENTDSSERRFVADLSQFGINIRYSSTSKRINTIDGWGKLVTPFGTFDQTIRMRTTIVGTDTVSLDTSSFELDYQRVEYKWFDPAYPIPVMEITGVITPMGEVLIQAIFIDSARCLNPDAIFTSLPFAPALDSLTESVQINFTNLSTAFDSLSWDFGDGTFSNAISPTHTYACAGDREVTLITINTICVPIRADTFSLVISPDASGSLASQNMVVDENHVLYANLNNVDYQWLECTNGYVAIEEANTSTFELPTSGGSYALSILTPNGCRDTSDCIFYDSFVRIKGIEESPFQLFPNPFYDILFVNNQASLPIEFVEFYSLSGKRLKRVKANSLLDLSIPFEGEPGSYFVKIITRENTYGQLVMKVE